MNCCEVASSFSICESNSLASCSSLSRAYSTDCVPAIEFAAHPRMHNHLLGGFVDREQLTQLRERLFARFWIRRVQHFVEHVLDQIVLRFEESDDFVRRFDDHLGHRRHLR